MTFKSLWIALLWKWTSKSLREEILQQCCNQTDSKKHRDNLLVVWLAGHIAYELNKYLYHQKWSYWMDEIDLIILFASLCLLEWTKYCSHIRTVRFRGTKEVLHGRIALWNHNFFINLKKAELFNRGFAIWPEVGLSHGTSQSCTTSNKLLYCPLTKILMVIHWYMYDLIYVCVYKTRFSL